MKDLLVLNELTAWHNKNENVLNDLSLNLKSNQVVGLLGLNGAGKTTFLNVLCGLHQDYSIKDIIYKGKSSADLRNNSFKENRYMVFAEDDSFGYFTFNEYLEYVFKAYSKKADEAEINDLVEKFNFEKYRTVLIKDLSTGNKRKAYLIAGFALHSELLLLDEPVNGLDFQSTEALYELIRSYKQYGTVLFSSHVLESISLTADEVIVLENGKITKTFNKENMEASKIREALNGDC